jgi:hypothetical protein
MPQHRGGQQAFCCKTCTATAHLALNGIVIGNVLHTASVAASSSLTAKEVCWEAACAVGHGPVTALKATHKGRHTIRSTIGPFHRSTLHHTIYSDTLHTVLIW